MNDSTDFYLAQLIDTVLTVMDKKMHVSMILVDLQIAFDTLDIGFLVEKMKCCGFWSRHL